MAEIIDHIFLYFSTLVFRVGKMKILSTSYDNKNDDYVKVKVLTPLKTVHISIILSNKMSLGFDVIHHQTQ